MKEKFMYCVYITEYFGDKMPRFYIGSTSLKKIQRGYRGSVSSKQYKSVWKQELKQNPNLFQTKILSEHDTRQDALICELEHQIHNDVVHNELFINKSLTRVNGFFGMNVSGQNNPMYGRIRVGEKHNGGENISKSLKNYYNTESGIDKKTVMSERMCGDKNPMYGKKHSDEYKKCMSERMCGDKNPMYGKTHTEDSKTKMSLCKIGDKNPATKMRKKYLVNGVVVDNAKKFCEENKLAYTNFIKYADSDKKYKTFNISRIAK